MLADLAGSVANCKGAQHSAFESTKHQQQGIWLQPRTAWRCVRFGTQFSKPSRRFWGCSATSLPEDQPDKASTQRHKALAKQALKSLEDAGKIGSEYGEGFVEFRIGAQPLHLDVDTLNERLKVQGANRMRHAMRPDEAYGMVFSLDNVIVNTRTLQHKAWQKIAQEEGLELPSMERQIYDVRPERAITEVLQWTRDWGVAQRLAWRVASAYVDECSQGTGAMEGAREWLQALATSKVPCALVSSISRVTVDDMLLQARLGNFFQAYVTAEDGMDTISQRFLSASIKLGRPPNQCVVFESSPAGITAAHNCTMKAVAIQGAHKGYHLQAADLTCSAMSELSVYNVRRLFANRGYEAMDLRHQFVEKKPKATRWAKIANAVLDP
ncbi:hypothetical protein ABBQ32_009347 [Trebouxia sp. C0010 RCD-2024]